MIHVICGVMGAGKSTYARKHYKHVIEFEDCGTKARQIRKARTLHEKGKLVAYITCYPTRMEREFFDSLPDTEVRWLMIDTDLERCRKNIIKRGRKSDADVLETRFKKNHKLLSQIVRTDIPFEHVKIFATEERW